MQPVAATAAAAQPVDPLSHALSPRAFRINSSLPPHQPSADLGAAAVGNGIDGNGNGASPPMHPPAPLPDDYFCRSSSVMSGSSLLSSTAAAGPGGTEGGAAKEGGGGKREPYRPGELPAEARCAERADGDALARHCTRERLAAMLSYLALLPPPAPVPEHAHEAASSPRAAAAAAAEAAAAAAEAAAAEDAAAAREAAARREAEAAAITPSNAEQRDAWETSGSAARVHELLRAGGEEGLTPSTLRRWLVARKGDSARAARDLAAHAAWRSALVPRGRILEDDDLAPELAQNKVVVAAQPTDSGPPLQQQQQQQQQQPQQQQPPPLLNPSHHALTSLTARGQALVLLYAGRHVSHHSRDPASSARVRRIIMYAIDAAIAASVPSPANPFRKIVGVFDLSGFGRKNFDVGGLRAIFEALNHHYPERLSQLILLRAPPAFSALWMLVKPFVDPVTAAKVRFVGSLPAMRRLMARLMCGQAAAEAAEEAERRRGQIERRRRRRGGSDKETAAADGAQEAEEEEERVPEHLAAAAREVERALRSLPAAVVGEGFGMPDARVPPIDEVTARLVAAGRLPRESRGDGGEEGPGEAEEARPGVEQDAAAATDAAAAAVEEEERAPLAAAAAMPAAAALLAGSAPPPPLPPAESRLKGLVRRMKHKMALDGLRS